MQSCIVWYVLRLFGGYYNCSGKPCHFRGLLCALGGGSGTSGLPGQGLLLCIHCRTDVLLARVREAAPESGSRGGGLASDQAAFCSLYCTLKSTSNLICTMPWLDQGSRIPQNLHRRLATTPLRVRVKEVGRCWSTVVDDCPRACYQDEEGVENRANRGDRVRGAHG